VSSIGVALQAARADRHARGGTVALSAGLASERGRRVRRLLVKASSLERNTRGARLAPHKTGGVQ